MSASCCASCRYFTGHTSWCRFRAHPQGGVVNESPLVFVRKIDDVFYPPPVWRGWSERRRGDEG